MKAYPSYKESGVEWIGKIPKQWSVKSLKYVANIETGNTPPKADEDNYLDGKHLWVKPDELTGLIPIYDSKEKITDKGRELARVVPKGSVLVCCIGTIGKFGIAGIDLSTNQQINSVTFNDSYLQNFGKYVIAAAGEEHVRQSNSVVVSILSKSRQANIVIPAPPLPEQQAIADFLDRKTAQIDTLIEKKQRQIDLLQEQRTALINHAVTKGLNPKVKMKDSGVEWLGEIPSGWDLLHLRRGVEFLTDFEANGSFSTIKDNVEVDIGEPYAWYVRATDLENERFGFDEGNRYCNEETYRFLTKTELFGGELLITKRGEIGKAYLMPKVDMPATLAPNLYLVRLNHKLHPPFAYHWFTSAGNLSR